MKRPLRHGPELQMQTWLGAAQLGRYSMDEARPKILFQHVPTGHLWSQHRGDRATKRPKQSEAYKSHETAFFGGRRE